MTRPFEDYPKGARALIVTAERLFGQHGLDGVSLRQIVVAAGQANTSAVHHHFGSREGLIQAVHDMRVPAMEKARQERLAEIDRAGRTDLEALLGALLLPIIEVLPPDERRSFAKFMLSLLTLDDAEHPFLRSIEQSPATFELNRRIAALFSALPPGVFNMRLRAAISLFLNAIAAERRVCRHRQSAYVSRELFWEDMFQLTMGIFQAPFPPSTNAIGECAGSGEVDGETGIESAVAD